MNMSLPSGVRVLERGWLSSNSVLLGGDARGSLLVDTGYGSHAEQTLALVDAALAGAPLRLIVNTHLHSDHCGGNARLVDRHGCPVWIPPGEFQAALHWDEARLSYRATGQRCERFHPDARIEPGQILAQGGLHWQALAAPGHDPHSIMLFEHEHGLLISADALWERGFGIVFPEIDGVAAFDQVEATLDLIASLPVRLVVPGHGPAFSNVGAALAEARNRLDYFRSQPRRHARHAAKALVMFHLLETGPTAATELLDWLEQTPIHQLIWRQFFNDGGIRSWSTTLLEELVSAGALAQRADTLAPTLAA